MSIIYGVDLLGTFVFAISGTLAARDNQLDIFGAAVIAFVTAVGGGTIRDILIGSLPVGWMLDLNYLLMIILGIVAAILFRSSIKRLSKTMFFFDTIGIALFTVLGLEKTLNIGLSPIIAVLMGVVSAVFGGVVRDILSSRIPLIFRKEIYATACLLGGFFYLVLGYFNLDFELKIIFVALIIIAIRIAAVAWNWSLPVIGKSNY